RAERRPALQQGGVNPPLRGRPWYTESGRESVGARGERVWFAILQRRSRRMNPPNDNLIDDIVRRIVETAQPEKIILSGSRARGDARSNSDFDVLVIKESSE